MTVETCPHYLTFEAEEIADGATQFKCCPPIREAGNREELWAALGRGDIDCVVVRPLAVHARAQAARRAATSASAWGGISSLQLGLPAVWTEARLRGHTLVDVVRWMAQRPADRAGLRAQGPDRGAAPTPTWCVFAPDEAFVVDAAAAAPPQPRVGVRRPRAGRRRPQHLAARRTRSTDDEPRGHVC